MSSEGRHSKRLVRSLAERPWLLAVLFVAGLAVTGAIAVTASAAVPAKTVGTLISAFTKHARALPNDEIVDLARLARQAGGTKQIGKYLGRQNLPNEVLEDTYLRIAVQQKSLARNEAEGMFTRLQGIPGFRSTLSKVVGNSDVKTAGHLNELRIADNAAQHGFKVKGIGQRFDDGVKAADTDIDVLLEKGGRLIAIEAKDYAPNTPIPMDSFRADMVSLTRYAESQTPRRVLTVFSVTNRPADPNAWRMLQLETGRRNIQLIDGTPLQQVEQIKLLSRIL
jgi:hypothetical protein